jgi:hypothetical protein
MKDYRCKDCRYFIDAKLWCKLHKSHTGDLAEPCMGLWLREDEKESNQ